MKEVSSKKVDSKIVASKSAKAAPVWENPLVPNTLLREVYQKMVETRSLAEFAHRLDGKSKKTGGLVGQEACRVSMVQGLHSGDLVLDSSSGGSMEHLLGAKLLDVLKAFPAAPKKIAKKTVQKKKSLKRLAPFVEDAEERLLAGIGAALLLRKTAPKAVVVVFVEHHEASHGAWRRALALTVEHELPVILVALTKDGEDKIKAGLSKVAHRCGVPCIPVDGSDAIALYRVAQESLERTRNNGGAVLIECMPFQVHGKKPVASNPVKQLRAYLLQRKITTEAWMDGVARRFEARLTVAHRTKGNA